MNYCYELYVFHFIGAHTQTRAKHVLIEFVNICSSQINLIIYNVIKEIWPSLIPFCNKIVESLRSIKAFIALYIRYYYAQGQKH